MKETDLAAHVVAYLSALDWEVHQEVGGPYGPRADIVAVRGPLLHVVETKTTLGLSVIAQAHNWRARAHLVSVAVPARYGPQEGRQVAELVLQEWGIGLLVVSMGDEYVATRVREIVAPRLWRRIALTRFNSLRNRLNEGTRTYAAAGNAEGKFWSPFKETVRRIQQAVTDRPGMTTKELVDAVKHHYASDSSARSCLPRWLAAGNIPGVRGEGERPMRWYPNQCEAA